jgi:hypothetical protein
MTPSSRRGLLLLAGWPLFIVAATGCAGDFLPASYLHDLRVLALVSDPVEVGPNERVKVTPHLFLPEGDSLVERSWTFCPYHLGPTRGYACVAASCETQLSPGSDGSVTADPTALAAACLARLSSSTGLDPSRAGGLTSLPEEVEVLFRLRVRSSAGEEREAVERLTYYTRGLTAARNQPPRLRQVELDGAAVTAGKAAGAVSEGQSVELRVTVDPSSLDLFTDDSGAEREEEPMVSFFSTAGRFEANRAYGGDVTMRWTAESLAEDENEARIYLVIRDQRGGGAVSGPYTIPIER